MIITNVSTAVVEANFDWTIVKVETDEGITGYGEAFIGPGLTSAIAEFGRFIQGEDIRSIDRIMRRMKAVCIYCSPGVTAHAYCGIETALLDALGKKYGMPVWQILGGKYRDQVRVYADCHGGEALESIDCMLIPRTPAWAGGGTERKGVVSIKHHAWDASEKGSYLSADSYAARAQTMASRGFSVLKFDVDVPMPYETDEYNRDLSRTEVQYAEASTLR